MIGLSGLSTWRIDQVSSGWRGHGVESGLANILVRGYLSVNDERPSLALRESASVCAISRASIRCCQRRLRIIGSELNLPEIAINVALWLIAAIFHAWFARYGVAHRPVIAIG